MLVVVDVDGTLVEPPRSRGRGLTAFLLSTAHATARPMRAARDAAPALVGCEVVILTDRLEALRRATVEWTRREFPEWAIRDVIMRRAGEPSGHARKASIVSRLARGATAWIDDDPTIAAPPGVAFYRAPHGWRALAEAVRCSR